MERQLTININIDQLVDVPDEYTLEELNNYLKDCTNIIIKDSLANLLGLDEDEVDDSIKVNSYYK